MEDRTSSPTLNNLIEIVLKDPQLNPEDKKSLIDELRKNNPGTADRWTFRWAIYIFGGVASLCVVGLVILSFNELTAPEGLVAIGSACIGGLAGLLAPGRARSSD
jgi:hypothetical protein